MSGRIRPSARKKTLNNVMASSLSVTDKKCIEEVFEKFEYQKNEIVGLINGQETLQKALAEKNAEIEKLKEENEKVNKEVDQLSQGFLKFKTGDYAKIVDNRSDHQFKIGTIVKLEKCDTGYKAFANGDYWWVEDSELTKINDDNLVKEMVGEG